MIFLSIIVLSIVYAGEKPLVDETIEGNRFYCSFPIVITEEKQNTPWETEVYSFEEHEYFVITCDPKEFTYCVIYFNVRSSAFTFCRDYKKIVSYLDENPDLDYTKRRISYLIENYIQSHYINLDDFIHIDEQLYLLRHSFYRERKD